MARIRRLISGREKRVLAQTALTAELIPADKIGKITQAMYTITFVVITAHCTCDALLATTARIKLTVITDERKCQSGGMTQSGL